MNRIITTSQLQKKIGEISASIQETSFVVTNHGQGKMVLLPYFDGCDETIMEYLEDFEMYQNQKKLQKKYAASSKSGKSSLVI